MNADTTTKTKFRGRYAPSPTGRLHLGNLRTALLAWLQTRQAGGEFILRIEDVDHTRCRPKYEKQLLEDLKWLGLDWDEGPDIGGPYAPYRQSERAALYEERSRKLELYPCTCTRKELADVARSLSTSVYPRSCLRTGPADNRAPAFRWKMPDYGRLEFEDGICGSFSQNPVQEIGDFVIRRKDGAWAYQLAVVIDDAEMEVSHVLRGADLLDNTPRQLALQRALGLESPAYFHAPLVMGVDGRKLSKSFRSIDIGSLREHGSDPRELVAAFAHSLKLVDESVSHLKLSELLQIPKLIDRIRQNMGNDPERLGEMKMPSADMKAREA